MTYLKPILVSMALATGAISLGVPLALAQSSIDGAPSAGEKFAKMDTDQNGLVSQAEFVAYAADAHDASLEDARAKFLQIAGDDGVITLSEFEAVHTAKSEPEVASGS